MEISTDSEVRKDCWKQSNIIFTNMTFLVEFTYEIIET